MKSHLVQVDLQDETSNLFVEKVPYNLIRYGNFLIGVLSIGLVLISVLVEYPVILQGEARITTLIPPESISSSKGGRIEKLFVSNGDIVFNDQVLFVLRSDTNYDDLSLMKQRLSNLSFKEGKRLSSFSLKKDAEILQELNGLDLGSLSTKVNLLQNYFYKYVRSKNSDLHATKLNSFQQELNGDLKNLEALQDTRDQILQELLLAEQKEMRYEELYKKGVVSENDYKSSKIYTISIQKKLNNNYIEISKNLSSSLLHKAEGKLTTLNFNLAEEINLGDLRKSFKDLETAIVLWEDNYIVFAKTEGKVHFLKRLHDNIKVESERDVMIIEPLYNEKTIIAEITISSHNYGKIKIGQTIEIDLDSYPENEFGFLKGEVVEISDVLNPNGNYTIIGLFENGLKTTNNHKITYKEGLTGSCAVFTENLSLIERIF